MSAVAKKPLYQSASRNETFQNCSRLYAAKYIHRLPDPGNDGANRGNTVHDVLELMLKPRHKHLYDAALQHQTCTEVPALWRVIKRFAAKYGVADEENLAVIDGFMMVAFMNEFYGPKGTTERMAERDFTIEVNEPDGRRYNVKGYIDKTFIIKDKEGLIVHIVDYKSSKDKFKGEKATFNVQSIIYQLAARKLHPDIVRRRFRFLFLKFPRQPWQEEPPMSDDQLEGYEWLLTDMQEQLEMFTLDSADDNLAAHDDERKWLCGREGFKKDGTRAWICTARRPRDYWVLVDEHGETVLGAATEAELKPKLGQRIEARRYLGCPAFYTKDGRPRSFQ